MDAQSVQEQVITRAAVTADVPAIVAGVVELLQEIGGKPPERERLEAAARELIEDPRAGVVLVAEDGAAATDAGPGLAEDSPGAADGSRGAAAGARIVGVLGVSWQRAIRVPGRYGLIQELWVAPSHRDRRVGGQLLDELARLARERGIGRLEVGLPSQRFQRLAGTEAFYARNAFEPVGLRMRRLL